MFKEKELLHRLAYFDVYVKEDHGKGSELVLWHEKSRTHHTIKGKGKKTPDRKIQYEIEYDLSVISTILRKFDIPRDTFWADPPVFKKMEKEKRLKESS